MRGYYNYFSASSINLCNRTSRKCFIHLQNHIVISDNYQNYYLSYNSPQ